jgi:hypothetical protein
MLRQPLPGLTAPAVVGRGLSEGLGLASGSSEKLVTCFERSWRPRGQQLPLMNQFHNRCHCETQVVLQGRKVLVPYA